MTDLAWTRRSLPVNLLIAWLVGLAPLAVLVGIDFAHSPPPDIATFFFATQDGPFLAILSIFMIGLCAPWPILRPAGAARLNTFFARRSALFVGEIAVMVACIAYAGWFYVYQQYPLSMDEYCATFDARIFVHGTARAIISPQWRPLASALQPIFIVIAPDHGSWASTYLPMNALARAGFLLLGDQALAGPAWAALSIIMVYAVARRFWPQRRDAAIVCVGLLASSSQFLVAAMSAYAMPAHLALNLVWLWFFLRRTPFSQGASALTAFAASGLHELVFHPLFAAPFIAAAWLEPLLQKADEESASNARRLGRFRSALSSTAWRVAAFQTAVFAAVCLFWVLYKGMVAHAYGDSQGGGVAHETSGFLQQAVALIAHPDPWANSHMTFNLARLVAWQNPATLGLAFFGVRYALRSSNLAFAALFVGVCLTTIAMYVLLPFQGHGWGYRYLHGLLGSLCLLAGLGWVNLVKPGEPGRAWFAIAVSLAFSLFVIMPMHALQVSRFISPYARAHAALLRAPQGVVMIDPSHLWYAQDLVRNDPWLRQAPRFLDLRSLDPADIRQLCAKGPVGFFGHVDGEKFGILPASDGTNVGEKVRLMKSLHCGEPIYPVHGWAVAALDGADS